MDEDDVQQFSLRWHNHQSSMVGALSRMLATGALADVTLSAGGTSLKAHKLVLASCSQYFAQLFKEVGGAGCAGCAGAGGAGSAVVVLGCSGAELALLLRFMYTGELTAARGALPALLRLAQALQVAGLTTAATAPATSSAAAQDDPAFKTDSDPIDDMNQSSPINLQFKNEINETNSFFLNHSDSNSKQNADDAANTDTGELTEDSKKKNNDRLSKLDKIVQNLLSTHRIGTNNAMAPASPVSNISEPDYERKYRSAPSICSICNKRLSNQYNLRVHMETHAGRRHACRACSHVSRSRDALRKHVAYRHAAPPRAPPSL